MNVDRVMNPRTSRTDVRNGAPDSRCPEQRAEIDAFEAWQRLPWTSAGPAGSVSQEKVAKQSKC